MPKAVIEKALNSCPEAKDAANCFGIGQLVTQPGKGSKAFKRVCATVTDHVGQIETAITKAFTTAITSFKSDGLLDLVKRVMSKTVPADVINNRYEIRQTASILRVINDMRITAINNTEDIDEYCFYLPVTASNDFNLLVPPSMRHYLFEAMVLSHNNAASIKTYESFIIKPEAGTDFEEVTQRQHVYLVQHNQHVFGLTSFRTFMRSVHHRKHFCQLCGKTYNNDLHDPTIHLCKGKCRICYRSDCGAAGKKREELGPGMQCRDCRRWFPDPTVSNCFANHKVFQHHTLESTDTVPARRTKFQLCRKIYDCSDCGSLINTFRHPKDYEHVCGHERCSHCGGYHMRNEFCQFLAFNGSTKSKEVRENLPIYVDLETAFTASNNIRELIPFHATVGMLLPLHERERLETLNDDPFVSVVSSAVTYENDDGQQQAYYYATVCVFDGTSCVTDLVKWILQSPLCHNRAIVAHNGNRFDFSFVLNELLHQGIKPSVIYDGHNQMVRITVTIRVAPHAANRAVVAKSNKEIHFIDSFKFMSTSLESIYKNLVPSSANRAKQFFPYESLTLNDAIKGRLDTFPPKAAFGQKVQGESDFEQWYTAESQRYVISGEHYPIVDIMKTYCNNDVKMLAEAFTAFIKWVKNIGIVVNPLVDVSTVAGMAQKTFLASHYHYERQKVLDPTLSVEDNKLEAQQLRVNWKDKAISVIGDSAGVNHSVESDRFFAYLNQRLGITVFSSLHGGERKINCEGRNFSVDGYMELAASSAVKTVSDLVSKFKMEVTDITNALASTNIVRIILEYQGCLHHGCPHCKQPDEMHYATGITMAEKRNVSDTRVALLSRQGYVVLELRPCIFAKLLRKTELGQQYAKFKTKPPYTHREALLGGRCEDITRYYTACKCESCPCSGCLNITPNSNTKCTVCGNNRLGLGYVDITSLYPWVLSACDFPVGDPDVLINQAPSDLCNWFGFAQCEVLPPRKLFIPVLPIRDAKGRLVFGLCNTCINTQHKGNCSHSEEERTISGIFFTEELKKAVEHGYVIKTVHQVCHWDKKSTEIFRPYIQHFFDVKMLCDGLTDEMKALAPHLQGDAQVTAIKARIRELAKELCGMELKLEGPFEPNKALRFIAKLLLNSLWGRFGMQSDGRKTEFFTEDDADMVMGLLHNPNNDVLQYVVSDGPQDTSTISITYRPQQSATGGRAKVNIPIAAMTTGWARLRMYEIMSKVANPADIIYYDTDSIIAVESALAQLASYMEHSFMLGQLKNELKANERITEFWCCGPKSYMYETNLGQIVQHFKGISLCNEVKASLCKDAIAPVVEQHVCGERSEVLKVNQFQIAKTSVVPGNLHARNYEKILQSTVDMKRKWIGNNALTYPYGFDIN